MKAFGMFVGVVFGLFALTLVFGVIGTAVSLVWNYFAGTGLTITPFEGTILVILTRIGLGRMTGSGSL